jgi:lipopolysaccharide/colanic/teichoic acid biosynthesis glycosyltransferase
LQKVSKTLFILHDALPEMKFVQGNVKSFQERSIFPSPNFDNWHAKAKRLCDIVFSAAAIIGLSPLFILVGLAIVVESRGSVFFLQEREGKDGRVFTAFKFRSMRRDHADPSGVNQTTHGDVRVTRVGRIIRRTSIDELPQLINVLRGDMSLVGPRPHVKGMLAGGRDYRALVPYYELRLHIKPGLTGLAQAQGLRGPTADADLALRRIDYDLEYIEKFSIFLDIKIIFWTLRREFLRGSGH